MRARAARWRRITSIFFRSALPNRTSGMRFVSANLLTDRRNAVPIFSRIAGDGNGHPKMLGHERHHLPPTYRFST